MTQFVFSPAPALAWLARTRKAGCTLPVRIGVPGPVALRKLIEYAVRCGVVASARALKRKPGVARLAGRWSPTPIALALARHVTLVVPFEGTALRAADIRGAVTIEGKPLEGVTADVPFQGKKL